MEQRFLDLVYQPITDAEGNVTGIFAEGYDVTERVRAEEKQTLLLRELNHRMKNLFAVSSGMVALSARSASTPQEMAHALRGRLDALAGAHDLVHPGMITEEGQREGTSLESLVRAVLLPYADVVPARHRECVILNGPEVPVGGDAITSLALVLHETATNSAKYGALSAPEGCIRVDWTVRGADLYLRWEESNGPTIADIPQAHGFGSNLVQRSIEGQPSRDHRVRLACDGLIVHVTVPLNRVKD